MSLIGMSIHGGCVKRREMPTLPEISLFPRISFWLLMEPLRIRKEPKIMNANGLLLKSERLVVGMNTTIDSSQMEIVFFSCLTVGNWVTRFSCSAFEGGTFSRRFQMAGGYRLRKSLLSKQDTPSAKAGACPCSRSSRRGSTAFVTD